jgi:transcriptional regulator GlxA family with amidase domain
MKHVTILGFRKVLGTSITIPMEMLSAADLIMRIGGRQERKLQMVLASMDGGDIPLFAGLEIKCQTSFEDIEHTDIVIIPALWGNPRGVVKHYPALTAWLRNQHAKQTLICAVGTGSFFLAEAGLLDNKVATTHWYYFQQFASDYPMVRLQRDRFITMAGNLFCAGSVNSVRDVMIHLIEQFWNEDVANQVSRHFTHEVRRSYSSLFLRHSPQNIHDDEKIIEIQEWIHNRHNSAITLHTMAHQFEMSVRSLNRHFKQATGKTPMQYLRQVRIDNAKELLKNTNLNIEEVAFRAGFTDNSYFTAQFRRLTSLSPSQYRILVRKKLFTVSG